MRIVLDLDGTLIDSTSRHALLLADLLPQFGINAPLDHADFLEKKRNGCSTKEYCLAQFRISPELSSAINSQWISHIEDKQWLKHDVLYDDALLFLENAKNARHTVSFLTARNNKENLLWEIEQLGIGKYAESIFVVQPSHAAEEKAKQLSELSKTGDIIFIGDTESDHLAGNSAAARTFILNRGFRNKRFLRERGIESIPSLQDLVKPIEVESRKQ